jgi:N-methylhydantoinase B
MHIFPVVFSVGHFRAKFEDDIHDGDIFVTNDPWASGCHLNDVQVFKPIFVDGALEMFAAARAHHGDVGGMTPGSVNPSSTSVHHEGIRFPIVRIARDGVIDRGLLDVWLANVRQPFQSEGVLRAQVGVVGMADRGVKQLYSRFGTALVRMSVGANLDVAATRLAERIRELPNGEYFYEDYLENSGTVGENAAPIYIRSKMTVADTKLTVDLTDSSPMRAGVGNAEIADTWCGVFTVVETFLDHGQVVTTGGMKHLDVKTTPGTVVDGQYPSPVAGFSDMLFGPIEGSCVGLLSQVMPEDSCPPFGGSANQMFIAGESNPCLDGEPWFIFEFSFCGWPALKQHDGNIASTNWSCGDQAMFWPVERLELLSPLRVVSSDIYEDSGGPGCRRGGLGVKRAYNVLAPAQVSLLGAEGILPRPGMDGGYGGALNQLRLYRDGDEIAVSGTPMKLSAVQLEPGDLIVLLLAGGGGYGDPFERPIALVLSDVLAGYVTVDGAREDYGVVVKNGVVDAAETAALRRSLQSERVHLTVVDLSGDEFDSVGRRLARISAVTAARLGVTHGDIGEYVLPDSAGLRAWIAVDDRVPDDAVALGAAGARVARVTAGQRVCLRKPWSYVSRQPSVNPVRDILALSQALNERDLPAGSLPDRL